MANSVEQDLATLNYDEKSMKLLAPLGGKKNCHMTHEGLKGIKWYWKQ